MTYSSDTDTLEGLARSWGWVLFYGILTLILGIMVLVWPEATIVTIAILFGVQLLVAGIFEIVAVFRPGESGGMRVMSALLGVLSIIVGLVGRCGIIGVTLVALAIAARDLLGRLRDNPDGRCHRRPHDAGSWLGDLRRGAQRDRRGRSCSSGQECRLSPSSGFSASGSSSGGS